MKKGDTIIFEKPPSITHYAAIGGKRESEGPIKDKFDLLIKDTKCGEKTWEKAESIFQRYCIEALIKKSGLSLEELSCVFAGDLQCQCTASSYAMRGFDIPFIGIYGACSTMAQGLGLAACLVAGQILPRAVALASSHFCAAERQFRTPLDYGGKRTPSSQWTVTGAGGVVVAPQSTAPFVNSVTFGRVQDLNVTDINNMGAAMAPAAASTLLHYFKATGKTPDSFDKIFTGDLGLVGTKLLLEIMQNEGYKLNNHSDCGLIIYDREKQAVEAGGSGAGCSACVLSCEILPQIKRGNLKKVLFMSTGALMSQTTALQGESIPCVAHLIELSHEKLRNTIMSS